MNFYAKHLKNKCIIGIKILPILVAVIIVKIILHFFDLEVLSMNPLFASIVASTIFLLGFLISGVLADYKTSESIPGDISSSLATISDEIICIYKVKKCSQSRDFMEYTSVLSNDIIDWFYKKEKIEIIMKKISDMNEHFIALEPYTQPNFLARLKQEQNNIRKLILRADCIRETIFCEPAYIIADALVFCLIIGLLILKMTPFWESIFFTLIISFMSIYMIWLIKDLDNPFDYSDPNDELNEVSLKPLYAIKTVLKDNLLKF
ncbi:MAG: hypothetical protein PHR82_03630 [Endomicrobiaceae bacterium]|nr:hypothetical protein [Endomicrobiaceae bacterium]